MNSPPTKRLKFYIPTYDYTETVAKITRRRLNGRRIHPQGRRRPLEDFWKNEVFNSCRRQGIKRAKAKAARGHAILKRLNAKRTWKHFREGERRKDERIQRLGKRYEVYLAWRRHRNRRRNLKRKATIMAQTSPEVCTLWNCPKMIRRYRTLLHLPSIITSDSIPQKRRCPSRASILSDLSQRSRAPIYDLRSSPLIDNRGFQIVDDCSYNLRRRRR